MIHLFLNGLGAGAGSGLTYLFNVVPCLSATPSVWATVAVQSHLRPHFARMPNVTFLDVDAPISSAARFWFEQHTLPDFIRKAGADVLISVGNFALRKSPVPQILLSGNSLYVSSEFDRDLWRRREFGMLLDNKIKRAFASKSVHWADCTVAPTQAFADELKQWTGREILAIHHGFDHELFFRNQTPLADDVQRKIFDAEDSLKLLFVSHYNYYRNFEILFQALPLVREKLRPRKVRLFLTCKLQKDANPGVYCVERASALIHQLGIRDEIVELGTIPYHSLHHVYRACDIYVTPAYAETFAHPLVEAMASGLPIVASDLAVHREVTAGAACYFSRFSPAALAKNILRLAANHQLASSLSAAGRQRSCEFSWKEHIKRLLEIAYSIQVPYGTQNRDERCLACCPPVKTVNSALVPNECEESALALNVKALSLSRFQLNLVNVRDAALHEATNLGPGKASFAEELKQRLAVEHLRMMGSRMYQIRNAVTE
jgi:glycosyltransferase involved in cell wall biosynthesis